VTFVYIPFSFTTLRHQSSTSLRGEKQFIWKDRASYTNLSWQCVKFGENGRFAYYIQPVFVLLKQIPDMDVFVLTYSTSLEEKKLRRNDFTKPGFTVDDMYGYPSC